MVVPVAMWTPSIGELAIVLVIVLVLFGAGKLPSVFRSLGEGIRSFREGQEGSGKDSPEPPRALQGEKIQDAEEITNRVQ